MEIPKNLLYSKTHEWVAIDGGRARVGLTDYAQDALGDIVFFNLPETGAEAEAGAAVGEVESVKAVSEVCAPLSGVVCAINAALEDSPEEVNAAPYSAWVFEMESSGGEGFSTDNGMLLTPEQYELFCKGGAES